MSVKSIISNSISLIPGWHTNRKIVVIESDDWGCIRMSSKKSLTQLKKAGVIINDPYNLYDSLASQDDLELLFDLLSSFKDFNSNHPVITANTIVANPDFKKIKESNYREYYFEEFRETFRHYPFHKNSFDIWKEGMKSKVFYPQYHGRDHVNIFRWLEKLRLKDENVIKGFNHNVFGLKNENSKNIRDGYMRALDFRSNQEREVINNNLIQGMKIFESIFGYKSRSFIAPSYIWSECNEKNLAEQGVKYFQGISYQYIPKVDAPKLDRRFHYIGQKNNLSQCYLTRNAFFEPAVEKNYSVETTLRRISLAFKYKKPAIIGSHRLNFVGCINNKNRDNNLKHLKILIEKIFKKWPDVEFMTSDKLGDLITKKHL